MQTSNHVLKIAAAILCQAQFNNMLQLSISPNSVYGACIAKCILARSKLIYSLFQQCELAINDYSRYGDEAQYQSCHHHCSALALIDHFNLPDLLKYMVHYYLGLLSISLALSEKKLQC